MISQSKSTWLKVRRALVWLACAMACLFIYWGIALKPVKFNHEIWLHPMQKNFLGQSPRLRMADWLIAKSALIGLSKNQIILMLGPETETNKFRSEFDAVYWLGNERGLFSIDSEWLVIKYNHSETVSSATIVHD